MAAVAGNGDTNHQIRHLLLPSTAECGRVRCDLGGETVEELPSSAAVQRSRVTKDDFSGNSLALSRSRAERASCGECAVCVERAVKRIAGKS